MGKWRVLAVDDDPNILNIIDRFLTHEGYRVETAADALLAWEKLVDPGNAYSFAILDHRMPGMSGLELLRRIKADNRLAMLPVIMQSGAASPEEIAAGIEAGAFYYLTKPWVVTALYCIVRSVVRDLELRAEAARRPKREVEALQYVIRAELRFSTLEDVNKVAGILAHVCPEPEKVNSGLVELLMNAVEHGNLGIGYDEKKELMFEDGWEAEIKRRQALPEYRGLSATVSFERRPDAVVFCITDQGAGFDWVRYLELDPERSTDPNGRGIAMARRYSFSSIEYQGAGNVVVATVRL